MIKIGKGSAKSDHPKMHEAYAGKTHHFGRVNAVWDLGTRMDTYKGETRPKHEIRIMVEFPDARYRPEADQAETVAYELGKNYTASWGTFKDGKLDRPSNLYNDVVSIIGRQMTDEEMNNFDPVKFFLGQWFMFTVLPSNNGKYTDIKNIMQLPETATVTHRPSDKMSIFDFEDNFKPEMLDNEISTYFADLIRASDEYKKRIGAPAPQPAGQDIGGPNPSFAKPETPQAGTDQINIGNNQPPF